MKPPSGSQKSAIERFFEAARVELWPQLARSAIVMGMFDMKPDVKMALEIGAAVCLGKPLLILHKKGIPLPPKVRMIADEYIEFEDFDDPTVKAKLTAALARLMKKR